MQAPEEGAVRAGGDRHFAAQAPQPGAADFGDFPAQRPRVAGKFLYAGDAKLWVRGATYGPFRPDVRGREYPAIDVVEGDCARMAAHGLNAIRTYTVPPRALLDAAAAHGLRVMVGLPGEHYFAFLQDRARVRAIVAAVKAGARACAGHPGLLGYAIGNEIPAPVVRWHGARRIEAYLERLYDAVKAEDPDGLVTYVNYPTTEYLRLPFLDLATFNVYLESPERLEGYLARLQNLAGDRPLVLAEVGLDSRRHGLAGQARALDWQLRAVFAAGGAGAFVFAWTDEWHRTGCDVDDWDFGLVDRGRRPKPALAAVQRALAATPFPAESSWPRMSVVVCSYNGARTIGDCLEGLLKLDYPDFEVIVVDDGSTDATAAIVRDHGFRLISTPNRGLSSARNTGLAAAGGEIIAYIDDDAYPDPHWLTYLASTFQRTPHAAVGGPNLAPPGDGAIADCVAHAPGGPTHVLLSDTEAEHLPGCNMAFRRERLEAIGGFDPRFRTAGDDVDVCWRLRERGWTLGFHPAAMVWHHRRDSVLAYWKQQRGYGRAEALLARKWPDKYNAAGHATWAGRVYDKTAGRGGGRIYHGVWGAALFQSLYEPAPGTLGSIVAMPEWYLVIAALAALALLGAVWAPLLATLPLLALAVAAPVVRAWTSAATALAGARAGTPLERLGRRALTAALHLVQPLARLCGRLSFAPSPGRGRAASSTASPRGRTLTAWSPSWHAPDEWVRSTEAAIRALDGCVVRGGGYDAWDLEIRGGRLGGVRALMLVEEHGAGRQLARLRAWPCWSPLAAVPALLLVALAAAAALHGAWAAAGPLVTPALGIAFRLARESAAAGALVMEAWGTVERTHGGGPGRR